MSWWPITATWAQQREFPYAPSHITSGVLREQAGKTALGILGPVRPKILMALALELIKDFEAWGPMAYDDASMYCTIGYGHLVALKPCSNSAQELQKFTQPLSIGIGVSLLDEDTGIARSGIQNLVRQPLTDEQFGALTSFVFNIGVERFSSSTLLKYLNNAEYDGAVRELPKWVKSKGRILEGLLVRRSCEAALFKGALKFAADKKFRREDCAYLGAIPPTENLIDIEIGEK
jgi:lysozyme